MMRYLDISTFCHRPKSKLESNITCFIPAATAKSAKFWAYWTIIPCETENIRIWPEKQIMRTPNNNNPYARSVNSPFRTFSFIDTHESMWKIHFGLKITKSSWIAKGHLSQRLPPTITKLQVVLAGERYTRLGSIEKTSPLPIFECLSINHSKYSDMKIRSMVLARMTSFLHYPTQT